MAKPGIPRNLVVSIGIESVVLTWVAPSSNGGKIISDYIVQYSTNGSSWTTYNDGVSRNTTAWVSPLLSNTTYYFRVAARNKDGIGTYTSPITGTPLPNYPSEPRNVIGIAGDQTISLTWQEPSTIGKSPISQYIIQYKLINQVGDGNNIYVSSSTRSYVISGLTNGASYICRVVAQNAQGFSPWSSYTPTIIPKGLPSVPLNLTGTVTNGTITLSWQAPQNNGGSPIYEYAIEYAGFDTPEKAQLAFTPSAQPSIPTTSFRTGNNNTTTNLSVVNGKFYAYRIRAFNYQNAPSEKGSVFTQSIIVRASSVANAPTNLQVTSTTSTTVSLSWAAPTDNGGIPLQSYVIQYAIIGSAWNHFPRPNNITTQVTVTGLTTGTTYAFRIAGYNTNGIGQFTQNVTATPSGPPSAPTNVTGQAKNQSVTLSWTAPINNGGKPVSGYLIQYSSNGGTSWQQHTSLISNTSGIIFNLVNGTGYIFRVAAVNSVGIGSYSANSTTITPSPELPQQPINPKAEAGDEQILLSWEEPADNGGSPITGYTLQYSIFPGPGYSWINYETVSSETRIVVIPVDNNITIYFRIAAINTVGTGTYSSVVSAMAQASPVLFDEARILEVVTKGSYATELIQASRRLSGFIKYKTSTVEAIRNEDPAYANFKGALLRYVTYINDANKTEIASVSAAGFVNKFGEKFQSYYFDLVINEYWIPNYTQQNRLDIFTHELSHALGVGTWWTEFDNTIATTAFMNGSIFTNSQTAYNTISAVTRNKIPIEDSGGQGTAGAHWEDQNRSSTYPGANGQNYPGLKNELMIGFAPSGSQTRVLSLLTIKNLVDLGYEEINPGTSEGSLGSLAILSDNEEVVQNNIQAHKMNCGKCPLQEVSLDDLSYASIIPKPKPSITSNKK